MKESHSYGVILFDKNKKNVLMVCRKDSIGFCEFLKGNYKSKDDIYTLFSYMTKSELEFLKSCSFYEAYNKLWNQNLNENNEIPYYIIKQKNKFEKYKDIWVSICLYFLINEMYYLDAEWGFPKGKKEKNETNIEAALRELYEETGINNISISERNVMTETREENNVKYTCHYFLGYLKDESPFKVQKSEISMIKFEPIYTAYKLIRPYFTERIDILKNLLR